MLNTFYPSAFYPQTDTLQIKGKSALSLQLPFLMTERLHLWDDALMDGLLSVFLKEGGNL